MFILITKVQLVAGGYAQIFIDVSTCTYIRRELDVFILITKVHLVAEGYAQIFITVSTCVSFTESTTVARTPCPNFHLNTKDLN